MSVVKLGKEDCDRLYTSLLRIDQIEAFSREEISAVKEIYETNEKEARKNLCRWFIQKLAVINQVAFYFQYRSEHPELEFVNPEEAAVLNPEDLYQGLELVQYNCIDNAGNDFMPAQLCERLEKIKGQIAARLIYSRTEVEEHA
ncbi:MAG: hypothetical protein KC964_11315 [Candidatus Omnitrophica bacterium]|nr:hypothetical protein [Candidatus Omnitrophota bacterium]